jgi:hypothetical protein
MGNACCSQGAPKDFRGPFLMTGDDKANMKQYAFINNTLRLIHTFPKVHSEQAGGIEVLGLGMRDEIMLSKDSAGNICKWGVQRKLRIFHLCDIKINRISCMSNDPHMKFFFQGDKFGQVIQWQASDKTIFNLWGKITDAPIHSMFIPNCTAETHDETCTSGKHLYIADGNGSIKKFLVPDSTIVDPKLLKDFGQVHSGPIMDIDGDCRGFKFWSAAASGEVKEISIKEDQVSRDFGLIPEIVGLKSMCCSKDGTWLFFGVKNRIVQVNVETGKVFKSYGGGPGGSSILSLKITRVLMSDDEKKAMTDKRLRNILFTVEDECDDAQNEQPQKTPGFIATVMSGVQKTVAVMSFSDGHPSSFGSQSPRHSFSSPVTSPKSRGQGQGPNFGNSRPN